MHCHGSSSCANGAAYGLQWLTEPQESLALGGDPLRAQPPEYGASPLGIAQPIDPPPQYT